MPGPAFFERALGDGHRHVKRKSLVSDQSFFRVGGWRGCGYQDREKGWG
jgi:hypothetical protein